MVRVKSRLAAEERAYLRGLELADDIAAARVADSEADAVSLTSRRDTVRESSVLRATSKRMQPLADGASRLFLVQ